MERPDERRRASTWKLAWVQQLSCQTMPGICQELPFEGMEALIPLHEALGRQRVHSKHNGSSEDKHQQEEHRNAGAPSMAGMNQILARTEFLRGGGFY